MIHQTPYGNSENKPPEIQHWKRLAMVGNKLKQRPFIVYVLKPAYGMTFKIGDNFVSLN